MIRTLAVAAVIAVGLPLGVASSASAHPHGCDPDDRGGHWCPPPPPPPPPPVPTPTGYNVIVGSQHHDVINGTIGQDAIFGLGDRDRLRGHAGDDLLFGGRGNDRLNGGLGRDIMRGGTGFDTCIGTSVDVFINCERVILH